jgi:hypothetical protein
MINKQQQHCERICLLIIMLAWKVRIIGGNDKQAIFVDDVGWFCNKCMTECNSVLHI